MVATPCDQQRVTWLTDLKLAPVVGGKSNGIACPDTLYDGLQLGSIPALNQLSEGLVGSWGSNGERDVIGIISSSTNSILTSQGCLMTACCLSIELQPVLLLMLLLS